MLVVGYAHFFPDPVAVDVYGAGGYVEDVGDFLAGESFLDEVGDLDFSGRKVDVFSGESAGKG